MAKNNSVKLLDRIVEWFNVHPNNSYNYLQISQELGIFGRANRADVYEILTILEQQGFLKEVSTGRYTLSQRHESEIEGIFERRHNGIHQVTVEGHELPFVVFDGDDMQALTGDRVRLQKIAGGRNKLRSGKSVGGPQARVTEVIERVQHRYVGVLQKGGKYAFVTPDNRSLDKDIYIPNELLGKAKDGDKVVVDFERWPAFSKNPIGRIADVLKTGFLEGQIIIPEFVLVELRHIADSADGLKRNRGRRGLDILGKIQNDYRIEIYNTENDKVLQEIPEVDVKLIKLAQKMGGVVVTTDFNLNKVASIQGVGVLNINDLANALKPAVLPGEVMKIYLVKEGKEHSQAVAYLDDGTMVVEDGKGHIGETVQTVVTSVLQTSAGRMIFARVADEI